jgi:hypothetical protein
LTDPDATNDCSFNDEADTLAFIPQNMKPGDPDFSRIAYLWVSRGNGTHTIKRCSEQSTSGCSEIVSPSVDINQLAFVVEGSDPSVSDGKQPMVRILIKGTVIIKEVPTSFAIQTIASQRNLELYD